MKVFTKTLLMTIVLVGMVIGIPVGLMSLYTREVLLALGILIAGGCFFGMDYLLKMKAKCIAKIKEVKNQLNIK